MSNVHPIFKLALSGMAPKGGSMNIDSDREQNDPDWEQAAEAERHREMNLDEALRECETKGVSMDTLQLLVFETGARWKPTNERKA